LRLREAAKNEVELSYINSKEGIEAKNKKIELLVNKLKNSKE